MKIAVVGGGLQGVETIYLAHKAGWHATLLDRKPAPPAMGLCDKFVQVDVTKSLSLNGIFDQVDLIIPALEDQAALDALVDVGRSVAVPLAFDPAAYAITSCKAASNRLFERLNLPMPPDGRDEPGPVIVKPSQGSGSRGVELFASYAEAQSFLAVTGQERQWVCQKYIQGALHSIEVLGRPGRYRTYAVTDLFMDSQYDCKRVHAPSVLSSAHQDTLANMALCLAEALSLKGVMDLEAIMWDDCLYLMEIDARIPSQTPTAVYWSTGTNLVEQLGRLFVDGVTEVASGVKTTNAVVYEHLYMQADNQSIHACGEHRLTQAGPLRVQAGWFGCDEAITDADHGPDGWSATMITCGETIDGCRSKRSDALDRMGICRS